MAFRPVNFERSRIVLMPCATTQTIVKGDALADNGSGLLAVATNTGAVDIHYVANETVTTTANGQLVNCLETANVLFEADCDGVWSIVDQGTYADLASKSTVNPDASTDDLFYVLKGVGTAETDTKVLGFFTRAVPNS
jgi:hypothetical protein